MSFRQKAGVIASKADMQSSCGLLYLICRKWYRDANLQEILSRVTKKARDVLSTLSNLQMMSRMKPGHVSFSASCLTADTCLTANPGVASSILTRSHTFLEIDYEINSTAILPPSADSRRLNVSYKLKHG